MELLLCADFPFVKLRGLANMSIAVRIVLLLVLSMSAVSRSVAAGNEAQAFTAAAQVYSDADYKNAELYFGEFVQRFPNSPRVAEAVLYQAQARLKLGDFNGALNLLAAHRNQA